MRSLAAVQRHMCTSKVAFDYTAPMPVNLVDAARGCDSYLCPFCGFAHFTSRGKNAKDRRNIKRNRRIAEQAMAAAAGSYR
jgi:hypothetical protein